MDAHTMDAECRECRAGRPHCHGTLIRHHGRSTGVDCTEPGCDHPEVLLHTFTIDCEALGCDCAEPSEQRWAV